MAMRRNVRARTVDQMNNVITTDCELIEQDQFTGQVIRREKHQILADRHQSSAVTINKISVLSAM
jgi:hypothetical protein